MLRVNYSLSGEDYDVNDTFNSPLELIYFVIGNNKAGRSVTINSIDIE